MLPFLKQKRQTAALAPSHRTSNGIDLTPEDSHDPALNAAADDLITAVHSRDTHAVAAALKAAFEICDSQPHEEGPHIDSGEDQS